ncbi:MAG: Holliday junction resolvase RuvX, partial [Candidatus Subteraquimicrobiales bacterium]|nr:Holliday junction resolvase RuvX [Candidatus Subteraquimicrobiales bacterium]
IGIAISDESNRVALPLEVLTRSNFEDELKRISEFQKKYGIGEIVVGIPLTLTGEVGPQAKKVLSYGEMLARSFSVPIKYWDERLSTVSAERVLIEANVKRAKRRKKLTDKLAATIILQVYLDSLNKEKITSGKNGTEEKN